MRYFFFTRKPAPESYPAGSRRGVGAVLTGLRDAFNRKVVELSRSRYCECEACKGIENLRLKLVVHAGRAVFHRVGRYEELAGVDVILAHRLLKNSIAAREYWLVTEAAAGDVEMPAGLEWVEVREECEGIGAVCGRAYFPLGAGLAAARAAWRGAPLTAKVVANLGWTWRILSGEIGSRSGLRRRPEYRNLVAGDPFAVRDPLAAAVMALAFPILLPLAWAQRAWAAWVEHRKDQAHSEEHR